jgi:hypothetical protein
VYFAVGDSIAKGLIDKGLPGSAKVGIGPSAVLNLIQGITKSITEYTVVLSSGASNNTDETTIKKYVPQEIQALKAKGARVILLGVGTRFSSTNINEILKKIAEENGAKFSLLSETDTDGVHPKSGELLKSLDGDSATAKTTELNALNQTALQDVISNCNSATTCDTTKLQGALEAFGVPAEQAKKLATDHTSDATNLLDALAKGDSTKIADATTQVNTHDGISLNPDTLTQVSVMTSPQQMSKNLSDQSVLTPDQQARVDALNAPSTFTPNPTGASAGKVAPGGKYADTFSQLEQKYNLPAGYLAGVAKVESGGRPDICASGTVYSSSACGMFQYTKDTWNTDSARINGGVPLPLSDRFDPKISAEVTAAAAANYNNKYQGLISGSGMDPNAALYAIHNIGSGGGPKFINAFAQDSSQSVDSVLSHTTIANNPSLYGDGSITLAEAQQRMLNKMGGSTNFSGGSTGGSTINVQSPFSGGGSGLPEKVYYVSTGQSPFANISPAPAPYQTNSYSCCSAPQQPYNQPNQYVPPSQYQPTPYYQPNQTNQTTPYQPAPYYVPQNQNNQNTQPVQYQYPTNTNNNGQTPVYYQQTSSGTNNNTGSYYVPQTVETYQGTTINTAPAQQTSSTNPIVSTGTTGVPVANILAQPHKISSGNVISLSWSSVGMSSTAPCQVFEHDTIHVATGNEGTIHLPTTTKGTRDFSLHCTAQATSQVVTDSDSVIVQ